MDTLLPDVFGNWIVICRLSWTGHTIRCAHPSRYPTVAARPTVQASAIRCAVITVLATCTDSIAACTD